VPGRTVRFFARGRRINNVAEIKSFIRKSAFKTSVWGHPHLLGFIEVGEIVRPVITRDDFVRNKGRRIFYEAILGLEDEIKNALDRINEAQRDTTLNRLEDVLREVLENIARQDRRQLRLHTAARRKKKSSKSDEAAQEKVSDGMPADQAPNPAPENASNPSFSSTVAWQNLAADNGGSGLSGPADGLLLGDANDDGFVDRQSSNLSISPSNVD